jgi:hypothetical protein
MINRLAKILWRYRGFSESSFVRVRPKNMYELMNSFIRGVRKSEHE